MKTKQLLYLSGGVAGAMALGVGCDSAEQPQTPNIIYILAQYQAVGTDGGNTITYSLDFFYCGGNQLNNTLNRSGHVVGSTAQYIQCVHNAC